MLQFMDNKWIIIAVLLTTFVGSVSSSSCHYDCTNCLDQLYNHCTACQTGKSLIKVGSVSGSSYGLCSYPAFESVNALGVALILLVVGVGLFLRSQHIFYFIFCAQTFGLLGLMELAMPSSLATALDACQYLMVFSKMQGAKARDGVLLSKGLYRLDSFLHSVSLKETFTPLFVLVFLAVVVLLLVLLVRKIRNGRWMCLSDQRLDTILTGLRTFLLLTLQQGLLVCYVAIRFSSLLSTDYAMLVLYFLIVVILLVDLNFNRIPYFKAKKLLNLVLAQRLVLPVFLVVPARFTHHLVLPAIFFSLLELPFLAKSGARARHYVYSCLKLVCLLLVGLFVLLQLIQNNDYSSRMAALFATLALALFGVALLVEIVLSIKEQCFGRKAVYNLKKGANEGPKEGGWPTRENTNENIALQREDTLGETNDPNNIFDNSHRHAQEISVRNTHQGRVENLLQQPKKKEKKFRTHQT